MSGSTSTPNRRPTHPRDRLPELREPGGARVGRDVGSTASRERLADERRGHLARVAHAEVDRRLVRRRRRCALRGGRAPRTGTARPRGVPETGASRDSPPARGASAAEPQERAQDLVGSARATRLDAFVVAMSVLRVAGTEVHGVDAGQPRTRPPASTPASAAPSSVPRVAQALHRAGGRRAPDPAGRCRSISTSTGVADRAARAAAPRPPPACAPARSGS